jgi:hypothetical protein
MPLQAGIDKSYPYKLKLDEIKQGTDTRGVLNFEVVMRLSIADTVQFVLPSGQQVIGIVKTLEVSESEESLRIYGDILNSKNSKFGFVFTKRGDIAGAIVFKDEEKTYVVRPNNTLQGYTFTLEYPKSNTN